MNGRKEGPKEQQGLRRDEGVQLRLRLRLRMKVMLEMYILRKLGLRKRT